MQLLINTHDIKIEKDIPFIYLIGSETSNSIIQVIAKEFSCIIEEYNFSNSMLLFADSLKKEQKEIIEKKSFNMIMKLSSMFVPLIQSFNLENEEQIAIQNKLIFKQTVTALIISFLIISTIIAWNMFQLNSINKEINQYEKNIIALLKKEFNLQNKHTISIDIAMKEAQNQINQMQTKLPYIANTQRNRFLSCLNILSKNISKEIKGLKIDQIKWQNGAGIKNDTLVISGSVDDFASLNLFEADVRKSGVFTSVPQLQDLKFTFSLPVNPSVQEIKL